MAHMTTNTRPFIEAEQYSSFILTNMHDGLLPGVYYRNVSDFGKGENLHIKTIGDVRIQEAAEDKPLEYSPIDTGEVFLQITDYIGDAWFVNDDLREDGSQIEQLMAARSAESTRAIQEHFESRFLEVAAKGILDAADTVINNFDHLIVSAETNNVLSLDHFIAMKLAFDKAEVPMGGRVAVLDPVTAATLDKLVTITHDVTPFGERILTQGMQRDHQYIMNLYGWDIITSNRLYKGDDLAVTNGVANVFMCVLDDNCKPVMNAWRRMPKVEGDRNVQLRRDEFQTTARWGMGIQRIDTLGVLVTSAVNY